MKIATKILLATLPLVILGLLGLGWMTTSLSERALNQLAEKWLDTKMHEAIQIAEDKFELLARYELQDIPANVKKAQEATVKDMRSVRIGQSGFILVVDAAGVILLSSEKNQIGRDASSELWFKTIENKKRGPGTLFHQGVKYIAVQHYFTPWRWHVLACAQQHEVYGEVDNMRNYVFAAAAMGAAVITLFLVVLIRRITAPLHILVREVKRIGKGNLEPTIPLASSDEIGILTEAFNSTAVQLSELIRNLEQQIAERKRAEAKLRKSEERYRSIFVNAVEGIYQATPGTKGQFISANPAHARMLGYDSPGQMMAEVTEIGPRIWVNPQERETYSGQVAKGALTDFEAQLRRRDGRLIWVSLNSRPVLDASGRLNYIEGIMLDITARKQAEEDLLRLNQQLLASEQLFRALVENSPDFIARYDRKFRRIYINPAIRKLFGSETDNMIGKTPADQSPISTPQTYMDRMQQVFETAAEATAEIPFKTAEGDMHWGHIRFVPEFGPDRKVVSVLAIGRDIHEIKENEQRFRMLAENFPDFVFRLDRLGRITYVNPAVENAFGMPAEAIIGKKLQELPQRLKSNQIDALLADIHRAFSEGVANESEAVWDTKIGERVFEIRHAPEKDATGNVISVLSLVRDITERKEAEKELTHYRNHLEEIVQARTVELESAKNKAQQYLDIAGVILVAIGADRRVTLINQKGCEVLGCAAGEIIGKDWFQTFVPMNVRQDVIQAFNQIMSGEIEPVNYFENIIVTQGGQERLIAWHNALLKDDSGTIIGTLSSGEDITEHKRAENQIKRLNQDLHQRAVALEAANRDLESFAYSVSHDLRAPLRHIDGFMELLKKRTTTALDDRSRHYMDMIADSAKRMGTLIDALLSFSRMGRHHLSRQKVDFGELTQEIIREFEPETLKRNIRWNVAELPTVIGDRTMLRMVLVNLISNALKFTLPVKQAEIHIGQKPDTKTEAIIFVRDNGVGFDMTYADKLFGVFQRLHSIDEFEGSGIGLANVHRIITRHGGRTWAEGVPNQGAAFFFSLPHSSE